MHLLSNYQLVSCMARCLMIFLLEEFSLFLLLSIFQSEGKSQKISPKNNRNEKGQKRRNTLIPD